MSLHYYSWSEQGRLLQGITHNFQQLFLQLGLTGENAAAELIARVCRCSRLFTKSFVFPPRHKARLHIPVSLVMRFGQVAEFMDPLECESKWHTLFSGLGYRTSHTILSVLSLSSSASQTQRIQEKTPRPWSQQTVSIMGQRVNILGFGRYIVCCDYSTLL